LQQTILISISAAAGIFFLLGVLALLLVKAAQKKEKSQPYPEKRQSAFQRALFSSVSTTRLLALSAALSLTAAYSTTSTLAALQFVTSSERETKERIVRGTVLEVFQWLVFSFSTLYLLGINGILGVRGSSVGQPLANGVAFGRPPPPPPPPPPGR
jgi:hypothetical protein